MNTKPLHILFFTLLFIAPTNVLAAMPSLCGKDALQLDFVKGQQAQAKSSHVVHIHGTVQTPVPGFIYSLIAKPVDNSGVLHAVLTLKDKAPYQMKAQVITPVKISHALEIFYGTQSVVIDVSKTFTWGPKQYRGTIKGLQSVCLNPVMEEKP